MSSQKVNWLLLLGLASVWGSSFFLIKKALVSLHPIQMACLRLSITGIILLPFFFRELKKVTKSDLRWLVVVGLAGSAIPALCFGFAQTHISSAIAGMLNSLTPLFTLLIGIGFFGIRVHFKNVVGVATGLAGAIFLIILAIDGPLQANTLFGSLIIIASICYSTSGNVVARFLSHVKSFSISVLSYVMFLPLSLIVLFNTDIGMRLKTDPHIYYSLSAVTALAVFGTALASIFYFMLVQRTSALFASMVTYFIPVIATLLGFLDGESFSSFHAIGLLMIISGVYLSRFKN